MKSMGVLEIIKFRLGTRFSWAKIITILTLSSMVAILTAIWTVSDSNGEYKLLTFYMGYTVFMLIFSLASTIIFTVITLLTILIPVFRYKMSRIIVIFILFTVPAGYIFNVTTFEDVVIFTIMTLFSIVGTLGVSGK